MRTSLLKLTAFLALASAVVVAQQKTPHDPAEMAQHHINMLAKHLSLSPQQQQQATALFTQTSATVQPLHDAMKTAHQNLHDAVQKNDTASIEQISNTIGNLMAQITAAEAKAHAAFYQTLTPEQQTKLGQMDMHHGPGMHGHGMHEHGGMEGHPPGASF